MDQKQDSPNKRDGIRLLFTIPPLSVFQRPDLFANNQTQYFNFYLAKTKTVIALCTLIMVFITALAFMEQFALSGVVGYSVQKFIP